MADTLKPFQYNVPTVAVDNYGFDAATLNAYIRKADSAYGKDVTYKIQGKPGSKSELIFLKIDKFWYIEN